MDFVTAVKTCLTKYADFQGRARRSEYWWFFLFNIGIGLVTALISDGLNVLWSLAMLLPSLAVGVRRLHDRDMRGWWILLVLVPFIGGLALLIILALKGTDGPNRFGRDPISGEQAPTMRDRGAPSEFDNVMDDSYRKSRIPRSGDDS
ncbi:DUF805 domain-containing protein [Thalassobacter stenotrophicus]|uniref:Inner membrane protein YhaI n=2 Tax=Thalassobacter stenotrophicus TaxID=266809 RepID=A0A0P1EXZ4_9RHOB|nr:DUF805 domain-containing protein [Thalassobacter stenotrophicus]PVZ49860.1 DUF805 domain-containing protein [Thalassobacter stenotrophicus]CUH59687.1 Inner membrane protein YhaI [Thalassobacter stenotrophicus]SHI91305.1 Uncharacterized membrane protein YhaH, DUF805 family [Thalassobacter stenotrophicus DSM 16310]